MAKKTEFTDSADRKAWVDSRGYVFTENGNNPTYYTKDEWNERQLNRWGSREEQNDKLSDEITDTIIELEDKLNDLGLGLSQEEMDTFLQKAIEQVTPYYDEKRKEIEAGIKEGKTQAAENILIDIRRIREDILLTLKDLDVDQAETEEDFVNTLANITAKRDEDVDTKRYTWQERIKTAKQEQLQKGMLTSGIGMQEASRLESRKQAEEAAVVRGAGAKQTALETGQKFDLERISLARETVQRQRERQLGTSEQEAATTTGALGTLGLENMGQFGAEAELARQRSERNITTYKPGALTDLEENRLQGIESRKLTLQGEALSAKTSREDAERRKVNTLIAREREKKKAFVGNFS